MKAKIEKMMYVWHLEKNMARDGISLGSALGIVVALTGIY
mgnify:FL=1